MQKIRDSKGVKPLNQLQRKIVEDFEPNTAYKLLTSCSFIGVCDDEYKIDLADISLSETDKCTLLNKVQEIYFNSCWDRGSLLKTLSPLAGIGYYANNASIANKLGNFEQVNFTNNHQYDGMSGDLDQMARYGRSGRAKMLIAELGGLKQAVEHFDMRSVPELKDLPQLSESLGKIVSLKDIEGLTLGLPSMTAASGKKYNYEVLYDNEFIKKLKKVSKKLGTPYLNPNSTPNATRNMVTAYG